KTSASSRSVDARRSAAFSAAGSLPWATAPSVLRARVRASSGVNVPTFPSVTRRVGAPRPEPARYLTTYDLTPVRCTRIPKPISVSSQTKCSPPVGLSLSTNRLVIRRSRIPAPCFRASRNHRGTTEREFAAITGNQHHSETPEKQGFLQSLEIGRKFKNIETAKLWPRGRWFESTQLYQTPSRQRRWVPHVLRVATKRAAALSTSALLPKLASATCAALTKLSRRRRAAAGPSTPTSVALWAAAS